MVVVVGTSGGMVGSWMVEVVEVVDDDGLVQSVSRASI